MNSSSRNDHYLQKLHQDILMIMDEIDRVCTAYNLRYYLMCGSCLGAVRHNGFIPWDDDLDIAMPRSDFSELISLISKDNKEQTKVLSDGFYLRWVTTEKYYNHAFAKICLNNTVFQESNGLSSKKAGIFVDIFPLDSCNFYSKQIEIKNRLFISLSQLIRYKGADHQKNDRSFKSLAKKVITTVFPNTFIHSLMLCVIGRNKEDEANCQLFYGTPYPINRMCFPKYWHGEGKRVLFEGRYYMCPIESELYLERIYGKNYMQIPPIDKRKTHYPLRVVFSDGEEMFFDRPAMKLTHKDILG